MNIKLNKKFFRKEIYDYEFEFKLNNEIQGRQKTIDIHINNIYGFEEYTRNIIKDDIYSLKLPKYIETIEMLFELLKYCFNDKEDRFSFNYIIENNFLKLAIEGKGFMTEFYSVIKIPKKKIKLENMLEKRIKKLEIDLKLLKNNNIPIKIYTEKDINFGPYFSPINEEDYEHYKDIHIKYWENPESLSNIEKIIFERCKYNSDYCDTTTLFAKKNKKKLNIVDKIFRDNFIINKYFESNIYINDKFYLYPSYLFNSKNFIIKRYKDNIIIDGYLKYNKFKVINSKPKYDNYINISLNEFYDKFYICDIPFKIKNIYTYDKRFIIKNNKLYVKYLNKNIKSKIIEPDVNNVNYLKITFKNTDNLSKFKYYIFDGKTNSFPTPLNYN